MISLKHVIFDERWNTICINGRDVREYIKIYDLCNTHCMRQDDYTIVDFELEGDEITWLTYLSYLRSMQWGWRYCRDKEIQRKYSMQEDIIDDLRRKLLDSFVYGVYHKI